MDGGDDCGDERQRRASRVRPGRAFRLAPPLHSERLFAMTSRLTAQPESDGKRSTPGGGSSRIRRHCAGADARRGAFRTSTSAGWEPVR